MQEHLATILGSAAFFGGAIWLTQVGRDRGKSLEISLFEEWGGKPSTAMLRHRDGRVNASTKDRYHSFLSQQIPDLRMPSVDGERQNPAAADEIYESACNWLIENTRDRERFRLVFEENMNYGFRRNYWALKPIVFAIDMALLIIVIAFFFDHWVESLSTTLRQFTPYYWLALAVPALHLFTTLMIARKAWVRAVADAYAKQLLAACDSLKSAP